MFEQRFDEYDRETLYDLDGDDAYDYVRPVSAEPYEDYYRSIADDGDEVIVLEGNDLYIPPSYSYAQYPSYLSPYWSPYRTVPPFEDTTTNRAEFGWKVPAAGSRSPRNHVVSDRNYLPPFEAETTNQATFVPQVPTARATTIRGSTPTPRPKVPFYGETTNRAAYTPKMPEHTTQQRSRTQEPSYHPKGRFYGTTTTKDNYTPHEIARPQRYRSNDNLAVGTWPGLRRNKRASSAPQHEVERRPTKNPKACPAERAIGLARAGRQRGGHFYFPVAKASSRDGRDPQLVPNVGGHDSLDLTHVDYNKML